MIQPINGRVLEIANNISLFAGPAISPNSERAYSKITNPNRPYPISLKPIIGFHQQITEKVARTKPSIQICSEYTIIPAQIRPMTNAIQGNQLAQLV